MKNNPYQKLADHIQPPEGLNERVLAAAREATTPVRQHPPARRWVRGAVCAALGFGAMLALSALLG